MLVIGVPRLAGPGNASAWPDRVLSIEDVAQILGKPVWKVHELCRRQDVPNVQLGRKRYVLRSRLDALTAPTTEDVAAGRSPWDVAFAKIAAKRKAQLREERARRRKERAARWRARWHPQPREEPRRSGRWWDRFWYYH